MLQNWHADQDRIKRFRHELGFLKSVVPESDSVVVTPVPTGFCQQDSRRPRLETEVLEITTVREKNSTMELIDLTSKVNDLLKLREGFATALELGGFLGAVFGGVRVRGAHGP